MSRTQFARLLITTVAALSILAPGGQAQAKLTAAQQAKANAALLGLWTQADGQFDFRRSASVTTTKLTAVLAAGANVDATGKWGQSALMFAAGGCNVRCARLLIAEGADPNISARGGGTALMMAASSENWRGHDALPCVKILLSHGASVNARDTSGCTALLDAIEARNDSIVEYLVSKGADVNEKECHGETALMWAAAYADVACVRVLLAHGAKVNAQSDNGETVLTACAQMNNYVNEVYRSSKAPWLYGGQSASKRRQRGWINKYIKCVGYLLRAGANVNATTTDGKTALSLAKGLPEMPSFLIQHGAKERMRK